VKRTAIVVSHTHWDREWYLPFQEFRLRLVELVDALLDLLAQDADFKHFMLDGQSVILDDYTELRPERLAELARYVEEGRISIGPWYTLPDEALVSGEALIRNLMAGQRSAAPFGPVMQIGYLPDPFGHPNQIPQIARGWGLKAAVVTRGVPDNPCEFLWEGADGRPILTINLRRSYGNAAYLYPGADLVPRVKSLADDLAPHATTPYLLFMNGTDHTPAEETIPEALQQANAALKDLQLVHGSLEQFVDSVMSCDPELEHRSGEMRDHQMHNLLPGVLSTRIWIKQRNAACQRLLERWAEPFAAWAHRLGARDRRPILQQAWRYLLQNHAHDSICGCSIDQVHEEMVLRFDWVDQIGSKVVDDSLQTIAGKALSTSGHPAYYVVVFNSEAGPRTDAVEATIEMPVADGPFALYDEESGEQIPVEILRREPQEPFSFVCNSSITLSLLGAMARGTLVDTSILGMSIKREGKRVYAEVDAGTVGQADEQELRASLAEIERLAGLDEELTFHYLLRYRPQALVRFIVTDVPAMGYKLLKAVAVEEANQRRPAPGPNYLEIANEFFHVHAHPSDGTITVIDKASGRVFAGLNRFVDGGDAGDEYNYSPPLELDSFVSAPDGPVEVQVERSVVAQTLRLRMVYRVPSALSADRSVRATEKVDLPIETHVKLYPKVKRVDIHTIVENHAQDHRLRVHFPTGIDIADAWADTAFDVIPRRTGALTFGQDWHETPMPTYPQQRFVDVNDSQYGLMIASDGLPEYEVTRDDQGCTSVITLLRCVGWLSRGDLLTRAANAGPTKATPAAQCPGTHHFRYSIIPHPGTWADAFLQAHEFVTPMQALLIWGGAPTRASQNLVRVEPAQVIVSTVKQAEEGQGLVVRVYNPLAQAVELRLKMGLPFQTVTLANLREEPDPQEHALTGAHLAKSGHFAFKLAGKRIQTILFG
jgi:alpha-mannosidase